ncbi:MAG: response regulator [Pseudomonadota bacterium]
MQQHVLVVDDHEGIRESLTSYLRQHDFRVTAVDGGQSMWQALAVHDVDLIILDVMLPGEDGLSLLKRIRSLSGPPVIMLTALAEETDSIVGLELGADDYVGKPFTPRVLLARVKSVLRRGRNDAIVPVPGGRSGECAFGPWTFEPQRRRLKRDDGVVVPLSQSEYVLLQVFVTHPRQVLDRDHLLTLTKGRSALPFDRSIDNLISRLRKKIEPDPANPEFIQTVWGSGYLFIGTAN